MLNSMGSVYFDAYTGDQEIDYGAIVRNKIIEDATNVAQDGSKQKRKIANDPQARSPKLS